jgi:hypothetical protein
LALGVSLTQSFTRGIGDRLGLGAQRRAKVFDRPERRKSLSHCIEAANLQARPHSSRSSHQHLSQRLRSSTSITAKIWKMRVPWRKRMAGITPAR